MKGGMLTRKLNYRFHNPNPPSQTVSHVLSVLIEANRIKVETAIRDFPKSDRNSCENHDGCPT